MPISQIQKMDKSLATCIKEVQRLDGIIAHFLKAIRPSEPSFQKINLLTVIEDTVRLREKELSNKKIKVSMEVGAREPMIRADLEQVKQVFFNVIGNAIDAVPEGSEIRIISGLDERHIFAQIVDQGSGISKENISRVFEPYFTTKKTGHGIGMMIVHRIMRDHDGEVGIDSKEGSGTIVTLKFPRKISSPSITRFNSIEIVMKPNLLIVDDEEHTREGLELALEDRFEVFLASSAEEAFNALDAERFEVVLTDLRMSGESGMSVIDFAVKHVSNPICIMMTAYGEVDVAVEAMKRGAFDFLSKPVNLEKLELLIQRGINERKLKTENKQLHQRLDKKFSFDGILGESPALEKVLEQIKLVGPSKATVLVTGETGTGKELVAQAIHQNSDRSRGPFVPVHCAALPANLLESELFGHEKGAFTGATERRVGRFESAKGGTLFLMKLERLMLQRR